MKLHSPYDERGFTIAELLVSSLLTVVLLMSSYLFLNSTTHAAAVVTYRAQNSTTARLTISSLEDDLRYANGVWLCAPVTSTPLTAGPGSASLVCPSVTAKTTGALLVQVDPNLSSGTTGTNPTCAEWILTATGLDEVDLGTAIGTTIPVTPLSNTAGVQPWALTAPTAFSLPPTATDTGTAVGTSNRLVNIDLSVNQEPALQYNAADTVTVHDLIAPQNIPLLDDSNSGPCT